MQTKTKIFMAIISLISPLLVYYDRKFELLLWRTNEGMEKLDFLGNIEFISLSQYVLGSAIWTGVIVGIFLHIALIGWLYRQIKNYNN